MLISWTALLTLVLSSVLLAYWITLTFSQILRWTFNLVLAWHFQRDLL